MLLAILITIYCVLAVLMFLLSYPKGHKDTDGFDIAGLFFMSLVWPITVVIITALSLREELEGNRKIENEAKYQQLKDLKEQIRNIKI